MTRHMDDLDWPVGTLRRQRAERDARERVRDHWQKHGPELLKASQDVWRCVKLKATDKAGADALKAFAKAIEVAESTDDD